MFCAKSFGVLNIDLSSSQKAGEKEERKGRKRKESQRDGGEEEDGQVLLSSLFRVELRLSLRYLRRDLANYLNPHHQKQRRLLRNRFLGL